MMNYKKLNIVIIEDDKDICTLLSYILSRGNDHVACVETLEMTRQYIAGNSSADIVFLDYRLPDGCGFDLIPDLRDKYPGVYLVAMSAQQFSKEKGYPWNGIDLYLQKPFLVEQISSIITDVRSSW
jgi:two-component system OmpR family response regulator